MDGIQTIWDKLEKEATEATTGWAGKDLLKGTIENPSMTEVKKQWHTLRYP